MDDKVILLSSSGELFNKNIIKYVKKLNEKNICYVTINKGVSSIKESFKKNKIDSKNFYFIDCITKTITTPKKEPNTLFMSSPKALTELSIVIRKFIDSSHIIIIDSLSTLSVYHSPNFLVKFIYPLAERVRKNLESALILPILNEDKKTKWYKKISVIVDKFITEKESSSL